MLTLGHMNFPLTQTFLAGHVGRNAEKVVELSWMFGFEVEATRYDALWKPSVTSIDPKMHLAHPADWEGTKVIVPENDPDWDPPFSCYCFEHEPVYNTTLHFGNWQGSAIAFELYATVDPCWEGNLSENVPLKIACLLPFRGVSVVTYAYEPQIELAEAQEWLRNVGLAPERFTSVVQTKQDPAQQRTEFCFLYSKGASA